MALNFDIVTGRTCILLLGIEAWFLTDLYNHLKSMAPLPYGPMTVPTVALELQAIWIHENIMKLTDQIYAIEATTGMRQFKQQPIENEPRGETWKSIDLISITRDLSSLLSRLAFFKLQAESGLSRIQQTKSGTEVLIAMLKKKRECSRIKDQYRVVSKLEDLRNWYFGIKVRGSYLSERATAQTQTVRDLACLNHM